MTKGNNEWNGGEEGSFLGDEPADLFVVASVPFLMIYLYTR